jgi:hypothetical protein
MADAAVEGDPELVEVACACGSSRRLARRLHGWQQERHEDADDGNDHCDYLICFGVKVATILTSARRRRGC